MPLGEVIGEIIIRPIFEIVFYGVTYWTGFLLLKTVTLGVIRLAPLTTIAEKNRDKRKWHQIDWSIWLHRPMQGRVQYVLISAWPLKKPQAWRPTTLRMSIDAGLVVGAFTTRVLRDRMSPEERKAFDETTSFKE